MTCGKSIVVGLAGNEHLAGRQVEIRYADNQYAKYDFAYPTTGKMPEKPDEIALDTLTIERLGLPLELGQICGLRMMGISFSDNKNIDARTAAVLEDCNLTKIEFNTNMTYTPEMKYSIFMENLPMYGGMVLVFLAGFSRNQKAALPFLK